MNEQFPSVGRNDIAQNTNVLYLPEIIIKSLLIYYFTIARAALAQAFGVMIILNGGDNVEP
uniref:Uncharacterized protein n=1 Tax=Meloidogyne incognita TaxID=6306 RepID=A0A914L3J8_MELIC